MFSFLSLVPTPFFYKQTIINLLQCAVTNSASQFIRFSIFTNNFFFFVILFIFGKYHIWIPGVFKFLFFFIIFNSFLGWKISNKTNCFFMFIELKSTKKNYNEIYWTYRFIIFLDRKNNAVDFFFFWSGDRAISWLAIYLI